MPFTPEQQDALERFLKHIDDEVASRLPPDAAADFFSILVDYSVDDEEFENKIAKLFFKIPDKLEELKDSIAKISTIRSAMCDDGENSSESRDITLNYFYDRIDEYIECYDVITLESETDLQRAAREDKIERRAKKLAMEIHLRELQSERQEIYDKEREERNRRREEKKHEEESVREIRQKEFDDAAKERRRIREEIELEIEILQKELQAQHEKDTAERKIRREQKSKEQEKRMKMREEEQKRQGEKRRLMKEEKEKALQIRQKELMEEQHRQGEMRRAKKKQEDAKRVELSKKESERQNQMRMEKRKKDEMARKRTALEMQAKRDQQAKARDARANGNFT